MLTIYLCFLAGGAVLPFLSFAMGFLANGPDADFEADFDADTELDLDAGSFDADAEFDSDIDMDLGTEVQTAANAGPMLEAGTQSMISIGFIPTSLFAISALAITFGGVGSIMTLSAQGKIITLVMSLIVGYLVSVLVQTILKSLKRIQSINSGINENELMLYDGKVIDTILPGQMGTVSFVTLKDVLVSYPARCDDKNVKLETGRIVKVKEIKNGVFIVEPKNKYE